MLEVDLIYNKLQNKSMKLLLLLNIQEYNFKTDEH